MSINENTEHNNVPTPICHIVTPIGMLGYGFDESHTSVALARLVATNVPTAIILDSGSTDSGPEKLALGTTSLPREAYLRDLSRLLKLVDNFRVPLIFSSAGGDGSDEHVREMLEVIEEIAANTRNQHYSLKTIALFSGIDKNIVVDRLHSGAIRGCGNAVPALTERALESSSRIVAQMGPEPFIDAMTAHPDFNVLVGGRAYDPSPYVAYAAFVSGTQYPSQDAQSIFGAFTHMGKIMECGGVCAEPKSAGATATMYSGGVFDVCPLDPNGRCTPLSVAAHTLYEKSRPDILYGPGGYLDVSGSTYEQLADGRTIRVKGSKFHFSSETGRPYQVKLEGAGVVGYRSMYMGSVKDPILINQIEKFLPRVKHYVESQRHDSSNSWGLDFHVYGKPTGTTEPTEIFLIGEAVAPSQELATSVAFIAKTATTHGPYPGQKATSGNFAMGIGGKMVMELGPCSEFCVYHLMDLQDGQERLQLQPQRTTGGEPSIYDRNTRASKSLFTYSVLVIGNGGDVTFRLTPPDSPVPKETILERPTNHTATTEHPTTIDDNATISTIGDVARVRSKNAGPYEITFDVMFESETKYHAVKNAGVLSSVTVAKTLGISEEDIIWCGFFDPALAFKATIPRVRGGKQVPAGGFMENDVHGSQQYINLMGMKLPEELLERLK